MNTGLRQNEREIVVSKIQKGEVGGGGGDGDGGGSGGGGGDGGGSNSSSSSLAFLNEPAVAHDIQKTRAPREATAWQAASRQGERPSGGVDETELRPCDPTHDLVRQTTLRALASMSVGRVLGDHPSQ
ncbi:hypothetical protein HZH68_013093 [Vespula germanica]|uniref:Uncharacterized protein n=1 Tax=Vespula germanica TaxID=30212 RepID=A0A834JGT5_VESGE|nr:hypothetical protein HZH68_013093 [Vespula germanica]